MPIDQELISRLKIKSGKYQAKLLDDQNYSLGSCLYLHYRDRFFILTCFHCVKDLDNPFDAIVPFIHPNGNVSALNLKNYHHDKYLDVASYEISYINLANTQNQNSYIDESLFDDTSPTNSIDELVIINATTYDGYQRVDEGDQTILNLTTLPYISTIKEYDNEYFIGNADDVGVGEDGIMRAVNTFGGMSGSPGFRIEMPSEHIKWIGIVTNGTPKSGSFRILDYRCILSYLDRQYFN